MTVHYKMGEVVTAATGSLLHNDQKKHLAKIIKIQTTSEGVVHYWVESICNGEIIRHRQEWLRSGSFEVFKIRTNHCEECIWEHMCLKIAEQFTENRRQE